MPSVIKRSVSITKANDQKIRHCWSKLVEKQGRATYSTALNMLLARSKGVN